MNPVDKPHRMTLAVYRISPTGERTPIRSLTVRADDPWAPLANPNTYPPCECPRHRGTRA